MTDPTAEVTIAVDQDNAFFWEGTSSGRLLAQRCTACERLWHPPGPVCPHCRCLEWTIDDLPHRGVLHSVAKVHDPGSPYQGSGYVLGLVELVDPRRPDDSVRFACNVRGPDLGAADLDTAVIGAPVELHFELLAGDFRPPQFHLLTGGPT